MTYVSVDVDLCDFDKRDLAAYVAMNDDVWQLCEQARERELERRQEGTRAEWNRRWDQAVSDGLIGQVGSRTL